MSYDLAPENPERNFHSILLLKQAQIQRQGNYTLPLNGRKSEEFPDIFILLYLFLWKRMPLNNNNKQIIIKLV